MADDPAGRLWSGIEWEIRRGRHPNRDDVIAALRLGDPRPLPADVQLYVARLLAGEIDQRGRQKHSSSRRQLVAHYLVRRVDRWHRVFRDRKRLPAPQAEAFKKIAAEYRWDSATAERKYRAARAELSTFGLEVHVTDWWARRILQEQQWPPFDPGKKRADFSSP
jgi:hypothetical protein